MATSALTIISFALIVCVNSNGGANTATMNKDWNLKGKHWKCCDDVFNEKDEWYSSWDMHNAFYHDDDIEMLREKIIADIASMFHSDDIEYASLDEIKNVINHRFGADDE